jgi:hypothetical protein
MSKTIIPRSLTSIVREFQRQGLRISKGWRSSWRKYDFVHSHALFPINPRAKKALDDLTAKYK